MVMNDIRKMYIFIKRKQHQHRKFQNALIHMYIGLRVFNIQKKINCGQWYKAYLPSKNSQTTGTNTDAY